MSPRLKRIILAVILLILLLLTVVGCGLIDTNKHDIKFSRPPCISPYKNYNYLLCNNIYVKVDDKDLIIPKAFQTDLASIPRAFWTFISPNQSNLIAPAILHDYLYSCHQGLKRRQVDEILHDALITNGVSAFRAYMFYIGVRLFGYLHYHGEITCNERPAPLPDSDSDSDGNFQTCEDFYEGLTDYR